MRMKAFRMTAVSAALALVAGSAWAGPVANDNELLLSGGFFHQDDSETGSVNLDLSFGHYFGNPAWQLGLQQSLTWLIVDDAEDPWFAVTAPFVNYHFLNVTQENRVVPFVGAQLGLVWNDDDATGVAGPQGGAKFFVTDQTFIQAKYRYEFFFDDFEQTDDNADDGNHVVSLGIGYVWGGSGNRL